MDLSSRQEQFGVVVSSLRVTIKGFDEEIDGCRGRAFWIYSGAGGSGPFVGALSASEEVGGWGRKLEEQQDCCSTLCLLPYRLQPTKKLPGLRPR